jgi:dTDP-4-dehydrorhamnose reductase
LRANSIDVVLNLIAATNVDKCEADIEYACNANIEVVRRVVDAISLVPIEYGRPHLIHISTDQVYAGVGPHEEIAVNPMNVYGLSKLAGEVIVSSINATVLRTNFLGRSQNADRVSLSDWIVNSLRSDKPITVFEDVLFTPLHLSTVADIIKNCCQIKLGGVYNLGSINGGSKAELALELARLLDLDSRLLSIGNSCNGKLAARRPFDMRMNPLKFMNTYSMQLPDYSLEIEKTAKDYSNEHY